MEKKPSSLNPASPAKKAASRKRSRSGQLRCRNVEDGSVTATAAAVFGLPAKGQLRTPAATVASIPDPDEATTINDFDLADADDEHLQACIDIKVAALQRLVPGGESLGVDQLLEETVDYIKALRTRVQAMRATAFLLEALVVDRQARMAGG